MPGSKLVLTLPSYTVLHVLRAMKIRKMNISTKQVRQIPTLIGVTQMVTVIHQISRIRHEVKNNNNGVFLLTMLPVLVLY